MITAAYWTFTLGALVLMAFVAVRLLRVVRESTQQWRARVYDLERERDDLIGQAAAAQGVSAGGAPSTPQRSEWTEDGFTFFSDGEVRDHLGNQIVPPGQLRFDKDYSQAEDS